MHISVLYYVFNQWICTWICDICTYMFLHYVFNQCICTWICDICTYLFFIMYLISACVHGYVIYAHICFFIMYSIGAYVYEYVIYAHICFFIMYLISTYIHGNVFKTYAPLSTFRAFIIVLFIIWSYIIPISIVGLQLKSIMYIHVPHLLYFTPSTFSMYRQSPLVWLPHRFNLWTSHHHPLNRHWHIS